MRYQQLKDILIHLDEMHIALGRLYQRWLHAADAERSRLLLAFMQKREEQASEQIARCLQETDPSLLHSWLDFQVDEGFAAQLQRCSLPAYMTVEQILEQGTRLDNAVIAELEAIRRHMQTPHLERWLDALLVAEQNRLHHLVHNAHRLDDL